MRLSVAPSQGGTYALPAVCERDYVPHLFAALQRRGYRLVRPTVWEGAIVYDELTAVEDLPVGWTNSQDGGISNLRRRADVALFGYTVGPHL